jgi:hypothetical protein
MPEYRQQRSHTDFITTLHSHFPSLDHLEISLEKTLGSLYDMTSLSQEDLHREYLTAIGDRKIEEVARTRYEDY